MAISGFFHALTTQANFQLQVVIGVLVILSAWVLNFTRFEWLILIITIGLVLTAELLNTVIEVVIDLAVKEELLPEAKIAKDVAAAAVLLISIFSLAVGLILFLPHLV
ncbi:MAG TPA: diacylglycerol kinase family protein [Candidatus Nanoarchaeia archaeon]